MEDWIKERVERFRAVVKKYPSVPEYGKHHRYETDMCDVIVSLEYDECYKVVDAIRESVKGKGIREHIDWLCEIIQESDWSDDYEPMGCPEEDIYPYYD